MTVVFILLLLSLGQCDFEVRKNVNMDFFYEDFVRNYQMEQQDYDYRTIVENNNNDTTYVTLKNFYYLTNGPTWITQCWSGQEGSCWMSAK